MTERERIADFIVSLEQGHGDLCDEIEKRAREDRVPVIRAETAAFLKTMTAAVSPKAILEVGTAVGYSALLMAQASSGDCVITTIEKYEKRILKARENFRQAGMEERIILLEGDAGQILAGLTGSYDLIFMDAAKGQYIHWLPDVLRLLSPGGMLISDNVLQDNTILESRFAVERRDRTIHSRMREYLFQLKNHKDLTTSIIPIGDGVTVSVKNKVCI
ncbi:MAG: O-methyltransferase [Lachnospiraceae bacterium]|mgnify:CR=1 FL=1|nr:O-methyltransferase [Lachnospiraceae bacterium]